MKPVTDQKKLMLVDGNAIVHRAFHALPEELATSQGEPTNAVFGFSSMLLKAIQDIRPTHVIMAMDRPVPTFRHKEFAAYKAQRPPTPQPLVKQFRRVREVADAMNIGIYEMDGYEADDVLGTIAKQASEADVPAVIVTGDLDALQLVNDDVEVLTAKRGIQETELYDRAAVRQRYQLEPEQLPDYKGLVGDKSDNIPGVPGIGAKTASKLLAQYESLEGIYEHLDDVAGKLRETLGSHRDQAFESRRLATILRDVPVQLDLERCAYHDIDRTRLINLFRELEFRTLIERLQGMIPRETDGHTVAAPRPRPEPYQQLSMFETADSEASATARDEADQEVVLGSVGLLDAGPGASAHTVTRIVHNRETLQDLIEELTQAGRFAVDTETTSTDPLRARLVGLSFATQSDQAWYVPVGHSEGIQLPLPEALDALRPLLESDSVPKIGHNLKYDYVVLACHGVNLRGLDFDTMIAAYLLNPSSRGLSLSSVAMTRLGVEMTSIESLIGKGKGQITMDLVPIEDVASYAGADADVTLRLEHILRDELASQGLIQLFSDVEMPLVPVLGDMERIGVNLDTGVLADMSRQMTEVVGDLEGRIYEIAGRRFNINSTQQLGQLLFGELKLPSGRRTKTGHSTDNEVLEALRGKHEIVDLILEYRQLIKLKNTYVDALPLLINPSDGRLHTDFNQTVAATGRLSSSNPNLQNIPIRTDIGRGIRRAFVPSSPDHALIAADYSQIELRILAAMSHDERLMQAFKTGEDIHRATASAIFGVPLEAVTANQRRIAKVVNFGIIYGIGEQRLAHETGITRSEAAEFIAGYNQTYAGVKQYMDRMRRQAALQGSVATLLNRRRPIPEIHSEHPGIRAAAERAAINMPIQGTAADIIKIAMIRIHAALRERFPDAHMVLQVHDELVFDAPRSELIPVAQLIRHEMVHALELDVPLEVEIKVGNDWHDLEPLSETA